MVEKRTKPSAGVLEDAPAFDRIIRKACLSRMVEERLLQLYDQGKVPGTIHTCIGQEFSGAVVTGFLNPSDTVFSNHRCHGHFLSFTHDAHGLIAEILGRQTGVCAGRGGSQHLCKDGFFASGVQGGIMPIAAGQALAHKWHGGSSIATVFIGDGTLGAGVVYETFNMAALWELPLLIVLEHNHYAQSTHYKETLAGDICARAASFGIRTAHGDTWNWPNLYMLARELVAYVRGQSRPGFLLIDTYRLKAHSKGDDNRDQREVARFVEKDPLSAAIRSGDVNIGDIEAQVDAAVSAAEAAPFPCIEHKPTERAADLQWTSYQPTSGERLVTALNRTFRELMTLHENVVFFGEDVRSPYGGAFKVSQGLSDQFPDRVLNTPISEASLVGIGSGLAMRGYRPFVEIMFGDFMTLTMDQLINHATNISYISNNQVTVNLVIRTPMGGGRGYGPTHSQTLDRLFFGVPGLQVLAINHLIDPGRVYAPLPDLQDGVTLVIENKTLYGTTIRDNPLRGWNLQLSGERFPTALLTPRAHKVDLTLIGYGGVAPLLVSMADRLFEDHDLVAQVICPCRIYPFRIDPLISLINRGRCLVIVEEGQGFAGFAAELMAQLSEQGYHRPVKRCSSAPSPIPAAPDLERETLVNPDQVLSGVLELLDET